MRGAIPEDHKGDLIPESDWPDLTTRSLIRKKYKRVGWDAEDHRDESDLEINNLETLMLMHKGYISNNWILDVISFRFINHFIVGPEIKNAQEITKWNGNGAMAERKEKVDTINWALGL